MESSNNTVALRAILLISIAFAFNFALNILLARHLSAEHYGSYVIAIRLAQLLAVLCLLGSDVSMNRFIPTYIQNKQLGHIKGYLSHHIRLFLLMSILTISITTLALLSFWLASGETFIAFSKDYPLIFSIWLVPFIGFLMLFSSILKNTHHAQLSVFTYRLLQPCLLLIIIFFVVLFELDKLHIAIIIFLFLITVLLALGVQVTALLYYTPKQFWDSQHQHETHVWRKTSLILLASTFIYFAYNQVDLLMLEFLHPDETSVGIFGAIIIISSLIWSIREGALYFYSPKIAPLVDANDMQGLQRLAKLSARTILLVTLTVTVLICIFSPFILSVFGPEFTRGYVALIIVSIGSSSKAFVVLADPIINFSGHAKKNLPPQIYCFILSIFLNAILIPYFGLIGAALSLLISRTTLEVYRFILVKRLLGISCWV